MNIARARSNARSLVGLAAVSLVITALVTHAPGVSEPERERITDHPVADTISLDDGRTLHLRTAPTSWFVDSLKSGSREATVGATSGGDQYSASEVLGGLVGYVPTADARAVAVGSPAIRANLHDRMFLAPASVIDATDRSVVITALDADGRPLEKVTVELP